MSDVPRRVIWDLDHPTGPAAIMMERCNAGEALERGKGRYVDKLPDGMIPGPHTFDNPIKM
jgi:hypothetical protein